MANDTEQDDGIFTQIRKMLLSMVQEMPDGTIKSLLASFLSFFDGIDDDSDAPDFEDIKDPAERARAENEYASRRDTEKGRYGDFRSSAKTWTASKVASASKELLEMRKAAEAANGGQPIKAILPFTGPYRITSHFGHREKEATGGVGSTEHAGVDFAPGTPGDKVPLVATMPGIVVGVGQRGGYGNMVEIMDIYGVKHRYGHMDSTIVKENDVVQQGQTIGRMGTTGRSTGVHLHYEERDGNNTPRDPLLTMNLQGHAIATATAPTPAVASVAATASPQPEGIARLAPHVKKAALAAVGHVTPPKPHPVEKTWGNGKLEVADAVHVLHEGANSISQGVTRARSAIGAFLFG